MRSAFAVFLRGFTLPFGATTGARIEFDGVNAEIRFYDSSNNLRLTLGTGFPSEIDFLTGNANETAAGRIRALAATIGADTFLFTRLSSPAVSSGSGDEVAQLDLSSRSIYGSDPPAIRLRARLTNDDLRLAIAEGSSGGIGNQPLGQAVLVGGTVTVNHSLVTANSRIVIWRQVAGGTLGNLSVGAITAGTSFVINSDNGADTSTVGYLVVEPI